MRILFLTQIIPYPPDAGPKIKTWNVLRYLASRGHQITLASFVRPEEEKFVSVLREICEKVYTVPIHRSRVADAFYWMRSLVTGRPFLVERDDLPEMSKLVHDILVGQPFDCIHADQLTMAQFALQTGVWEKQVGSKPPVRTFDAHNAVWTIVERMSQTLPWYLKPMVKLEANRIKLHEGMILHKFDHTLAVTETDRQDLLEAYTEYLNHKSSNHLSGGENSGSIDITVVPIAVDTAQLKTISREPGSTNILTLGTLHYPPNADGIRWFIQEIFPTIKQQIPGATLTVIGKNPPQDFLDLANNNPQSYAVTGYVPDLVPYLQKAAVIVIPVRVGSGMRVRILEAFAEGMPVVTTAIGIEGILARPEHDVLVRDTPNEFAEAVIRILRDSSLQEQLSINGRHLAESCYDWQVVLKRMDSIYMGV